MHHKLIANLALLLPLMAAAQTFPAQPLALAYDHIREADVFWKKRIWRVVDTRMKQNLPFVYPKEPLMKILIAGIKERSLRVYDPFYGDDFSVSLDPMVLDKMLNRIDTVCVPHLSEYWRDTCFEVRTPFDPLRVTRFRIKEDWIFDEERSEMVVRILGIAPVRDVMDPTTGEKRGESIMFWINYPESRQFLGSHFAFNPHNDFIRHTWENIFEMRFFDSYIVKEDNVYDREISSYASGVDAVLESERIKMELFRFEHELWSY